MSEERAALEGQLGEAIPGFAVLDRDLRVGDVHADLAGRAGDGRLVLVREVQAVDAEVVTGVLDLLAAARSQGALLARHLGTGPDGPAPLVVIVAAQVDERSARRLAALDPEAVRLLEVREIASARAHSTYLVAHGGQAEPPSAAAVGERLTDLDPQTRRRVDLFVERLGRMDEELSLATIDGGLEWRWRGRPVCTVEVESGQARATVAGDDPRPLVDDEAVELLLDATLGRWIALTEEAEGLGAVEMRPPTPRPLIDPEELDALRE
jgi:hypothetical protein